MKIQYGIKFVNLTPHQIDDCQGAVVYPPSGQVARVQVTRQAVAFVEGSTLYAASYGAVEGLPEPQENTIFIVSALVRQAVPERQDVVSPGPLARDNDGKPIGCQGFDSNIELI